MFHEHDVEKYSIIKSMYCDLICEIKSSIKLKSISPSLVGREIFSCLILSQPALFVHSKLPYIVLDIAMERKRYWLGVNF